MKSYIIILIFTVLLIPIKAHATLIGYADVVLDYYDSGAGPIEGPYGGSTSSYPISVSPDIILGDNEEFLSLPTGSYVTVGFVDESVIDGTGDDIFIEEIGAAGETAEVYISHNLVDYFLLGIANGATTTAFDLSDISFLDPVLAIKIVGLDNFGASPGFDVVNVQVLPGSIGEAIPGVVPVPTPVLVSEPKPMVLLCFGLGLVGFFRRKKVVFNNHMLLKNF